MLLPSTPQVPQNKILKSRQLRTGQNRIVTSAAGCPAPGSLCLRTEGGDGAQALFCNDISVI